MAPMNPRLLRPRAKGPTVPGAPVITFVADGEPAEWSAPNDGGSPIVEYRVYLNDVLFETTTFTATVSPFVSGDIVAVSAVNAVGEGPRSAPVIVG